MLTNICSISIGAFHPLLVHLPLGMVFLALIFTLMPRTQRAALEYALFLTLSLSLLLSIFTCITGYIHAQSGDFEASIVFKHQWTAILSTLLLLSAVVFKSKRRPLTWLTATAMVVTGHFGGTLTHGEGFLLNVESVKQEIGESVKQGISESVKQGIGESVNRGNSEMIDLYVTEIKPILEAKCYSCHSSLKRKGGLRLDEKSFILRGGKHGRVISFGIAAKSPIYTSLLLPADDEKHMPPKGKRQLTNLEIATIHRWVSMDDPFQPMSINKDEKRNQIREDAANHDVQPVTNPPIATSSVKAKIQTLVNIVEADPIVIKKLQQAEVIITPSNMVKNGLHVNFVNVKQLDENILTQLELLNKQVVQIKLTGQKINQKLIRILETCNNLRQLQLERTNVTDADMEHILGLPALEYLNVYGTSLTDKSLQLISESSSLKHMYVWETGLSDKAVNEFRKKHPGIHIDAGEGSNLKKDSTKSN